MYENVELESKRDCLIQDKFIKEERIKCIKPGIG
jgi:hypothetical protein